MTIHLVSTRRARNTHQARDLASPPKKNPNTKGSTRRARNTQARGFGIAPQKRQQKNPSTKGSTRRAKNTQARDLASPPKKGQQKNPSTKGSTRRARNTQARDLASPPPPKKAKKNKHERQHLTSKKHPSEGFGIAPKKGKAALG